MRATVPVTGPGGRTAAMPASFTGYPRAAAPPVVSSHAASQHDQAGVCVRNTSPSVRRLVTPLVAGSTTPSHPPPAHCSSSPQVLSVSPMPSLAAQAGLATASWQTLPPTSGHIGQDHILRPSASTVEMGVAGASPRTVNFAEPVSAPVSATVVAASLTPAGPSCIVRPSLTGLSSSLPSCTTRSTIAPARQQHAGNSLQAPSHAGSVERLGMSYSREGSPMRTSVEIATPASVVHIAGGGTTTVGSTECSAKGPLVRPTSDSASVVAVQSSVCREGPLLRQAADVPNGIAMHTWREGNSFGTATPETGAGTTVTVAAAAAAAAAASASAAEPRQVPQRTRVRRPEVQGRQRESSPGSSGRPASVGTNRFASRVAHAGGDNEVTTLQNSLQSPRDCRDASREEQSGYSSPSRRRGASPSQTDLHSAASRRGGWQPLASASRADRRDRGQGVSAGGEEMATVRTLRKEVEDLKHENSRLQDKLCKARNLVVLLQRQAEEARAERDKEHKRSESLQLSSQQLHRQLRRETARAHLLERTLAAASRGETVAPIPPREPHSTEGDEFSGKGMLLNGRSSPPAPAPDGHAAWANAASAASATRNEGELAETVTAQELLVASQATAGVLDAQEHHVATDASLTGGTGGLERSWEFVVQGQHDPNIQGDFAPKLVSRFPDDAVVRACSRGVAFVCTRGRRLDGTVPNQDDFLVARHTLANDGHIALYGVFDGHGPAGHHCAAFARGSLPESLFGQHTLLMRPEDTLRQAFQQTQQNLLQQPFDTETSGTTAALALVLNILANPGEQAGAESSAAAPEAAAGASSKNQSETWLFVAHVGDSRVLLASRREEEPSSFSVTALTRDHRPDDSEEAERIKQQGGEVRRMNRSSGAIRVFARDQDRPALALTRTLGASSASGCGVSSEPEVAAYRLRPGVDVLLMLGTDGLFEFCGNTDAAVRMLRDNVSIPVLEGLCQESRQQWAQSSYNETVDDITAIAVSLPSQTAGHGTGAAATSAVWRGEE